MPYHLIKLGRRRRCFGKTAVLVSCVMPIRAHINIIYTCILFIRIYYNSPRVINRNRIIVVALFFFNLFLYV